MTVRKFDDTEDGNDKNMLYSIQKDQKKMIP